MNIFPLTLNIDNGNLVRVRYSVVVVTLRVVVVDEPPHFQSLIKVVGVVDSLSVVISRQCVNEIKLVYVQPVHVYWKSACKRMVVQLVRVVVGISEQLLYERDWTDVRVHCANQRFRHVG